MIYHVTVTRRVIHTQTQSVVLDARDGASACAATIGQLDDTAWVTDPSTVTDPVVEVECVNEAGWSVFLYPAYRTRAYQPPLGAKEIVK